MNRVHVYGTTLGKAGPLDEPLQVTPSQDNMPAITSAHPLRYAGGWPNYFHIGQAPAIGPLAKHTGHGGSLPLASCGADVLVNQVHQPVKWRIALQPAGLYLGGTKKTSDWL